MRAAPALLGPLLPAAIAAAAVALAAVYMAQNSLAELSARYQVVDDAFYYLEIANNLRLGCGASFDCLNPTNGYHPLWLLILAPLTAILPEPGDAQAWLALATGIGLFFAAGAVVTLTARRLMPGARLAPYVPALLLVANPSLFFVAINGLETPAAFLAMALLMDATSRALTRPEFGKDFHRGVAFRPALAVAAAGALAFLVRLDYALVAAMALAALLLTDLTRLRRPGQGSLVAGAVLAAVVLAYVGLNLALFDAATPVSGSIKQEGVLDRLDFGALYGPAGAVSALFWPLRFATWPGNPLFLLLAAIPTAIAAARARHSIAPARDLFLALFGWGHAALYLLLQSSGPEYYFVPLLLSVAWSSAVTAEVLERRLGRRGKTPAGEALVVLAVAGPLAAGAVLDHDRPIVPWRLERLQAIAWMDETLPAGARIGSWWSGAVGYYSRHAIINLDGLVNSRSYLDLLRQCRIAPYLLGNEVLYLADYMTFDMIEAGTADDTLFPGRCWAELWRDLAAAGYHLEPLRIFPDPEHPQDRGFAVLALRRP